MKIAAIVFTILTLVCGWQCYRSVKYGWSIGHGIDALAMGASTLICGVVASILWILG